MLIHRRLSSRHRHFVVSWLWGRVASQRPSHRLSRCVREAAKMDIAADEISSFDTLLKGENHAEELKKDFSQINFGI